MHQHPRPPPVMASPASSPRTNPTRTNNSREDRSSASTPLMDEMSYRDPQAVAGAGDTATGPSKDAVKKLDQIIQNFHTKAAIVILQSRMALPVLFTRDNTRKVNRWFQLETDDTDAFRNELRLWKTSGSLENRPPPLIVEVYLDTSGLKGSQSLVIVDDQGKRWDVMEALRNSSDGGQSRTDVILERWKIELQPASPAPSADFGGMLPTVYKKCIVFFRSLYATSKFVPGWKLAKTLAKSNSASSQLRINCRILNGALPTDDDGLTRALHEGDTQVTTNYFLGETDTPAGRFAAQVTYRNDCNFRVDDAEALLSSQFMGADERNFQPSLRGFTSRAHAKQAEPGSLPAHRQRTDEREPIQAYGSMSTFHGDGPPSGSSPISALRAQKPIGSDSSSPPTNSLSRMRSLRDGASVPRRPSVSFQPFKAGTLSHSPQVGTSVPSADAYPPPSPQSASRPSSLLATAQSRHRSLTAGMPATLRGPPVDGAAASPASSSPRPAPISKYSSSFTHRRNRPSYGGASRVEDDQGSSGKQSLASSAAHPGSGLFAEMGGASSGSLQADDDNISEFLKLLETKKTLKSLEPSHVGESSTKRTSAQLSRFQLMKESHNALTDSMISSMQLHRSSSSSSRQLSSVPPMVAAASMSTSSSPGKPVSPHTPHTPAIPSRLSAGSTAEHPQPLGTSRRSRPTVSEQRVDTAGTNAIDIPVSPRPYYPNRRSSSVAQQNRASTDDVDLGDITFGGQRSISLGTDDREPPSLSALLNLGQLDTADVAGAETEIVESPAVDTADGPPMPRSLRTGSSSSPYRPRLGPSSGPGGRGMTPPQTGSYAGSTMDRPAGRNSLTRPSGPYDPDDEPLLFDMSEIGRDSRRSIDDAHAAGSGYYPSRGADSASSSRRGSRRW